MKLILTIKVFNTEDNSGFIFEKVYESTVVPRIGEKIKDSLFDVDREVIDVIYDLSLEECYIILIDKEVSDNNLSNHLQEISELHNWIKKDYK